MVNTLCTITVISRGLLTQYAVKLHTLKNGIEGFYDDAVGHVYIVDGIHAQMDYAEDVVSLRGNEMTHLV